MRKRNDFFCFKWQRYIFVDKINLIHEILRTKNITAIKLNQTNILSESILILCPREWRRFGGTRSVLEILQRPWSSCYFRQQWYWTFVCPQEFDHSIENWFLLQSGLNCHQKWGEDWVRKKIHPFRTRTWWAPQKENWVLRQRFCWRNQKSWLHHSSQLKGKPNCGTWKEDSEPRRETQKSKCSRNRTRKQNQPTERWNFVIKRQRFNRPKAGYCLAAPDRQWETDQGDRNLEG